MEKMTAPERRMEIVKELQTVTLMEHWIHLEKMTAILKVIPMEGDRK